MMVREKLADGYRYLFVCGPGAEFQTGVNSLMAFIDYNSSASFTLAFIV